MRKALLLILLIGVAGAGFMYFNRADSDAASGRAGGGPGQAGDQRPGGGGGGFGGGPGGGGFFVRPPMTVEIAKASRATVTESILVVGNLIGAATVEVASKVSGRLQQVNVGLGDSVRKGQTLATVEDREIQEQVKQAEASFAVGEATIRQREADLKFADTNLERSRNLFNRQLIPRQTLDDSESRYQAANAQLDLARAQFEQAKARLEELRITLSNTRVVSPVDGFVGKRNLDPGAYVTSNSSVLSVVDIHVVRLVVNLVEKDLRRVDVGSAAVAEVDAYPGESFNGRVARIAPVLDPSTRTAEMEIELPNPTYRLKPGMYSRVRLTTEQRQNALVVPRNAIVDTKGKRGVFLFDGAEQKARFREVALGLADEKQVEIVNGIREGETIITTGASALTDGETVLLPDGAGRGPEWSAGAGKPGGRGPNGTKTGGVTPNRGAQSQP
jgi:RND family efflux transporter MFP subunit